MTYAIDFSAMKRRKTNMPSNARLLPIKVNEARHRSSKPRVSICHQVELAPGPGTARNMKIIRAVPMRVRRAVGLNSCRSLGHEEQHDRHRAGQDDLLIIGHLAQPMISVKSTKARLPPRIHQFARACALLSSRRAIASVDAMPASCLARPLQHCRQNHPKHRDHRNQQRHRVYVDIEGIFAASAHAL